MTHSDRGQSRNRRGRFTRSRDTAERDAEATRLRAAGKTYAAIAAALGFADPAGARRAVQRALADVVRDDVDMLRQLECERLDELTRHAWRVMEAEHLLADHGHVIYGPDGQPLQDWRPTLRAIDTLLRISERRARLLGLDQPLKATVITIGEGDVDRAIAELAAELAAGGGETP